MKIGILTFHNADNYGAVLQCYALQEYVKSIVSKDDEVCVVNYRSEKIEDLYKLFPKAFGFGIKSIIKDIFRSFHTIKRYVNFQKFRKKHLHLGSDSLSEYNLIIYGSDQIWNTSIRDEVYFGSNFFGRKIAFSASCGCEFEISEKIMSLVNQFENISCRESSFAEKLSHIIGKKIPTSCDPVFLMESWDKIALPPKESNYILLYIIMPNPHIEREAIRLAKIMNKKVIRIDWINNVNYIFDTKIKYKIAIPIDKFLGYIANADLILTTSFHGTAFSILFRKPFYVFKLNNRMDRIVDLLSKIKLDYLYVDKITSNAIPTNIYTDIVEEALSIYINYSKSLLKSFL